MKHFVQLLCALTLMLASQVQAGPAEEVAEIAGPRLRALVQGDVDGYTAAYADNAVLSSSLSAFRIEGKEAIRAYYVELFQNYPRRRVLQRQPLVRVYNEDLVVQNSYSVLYLTDSKGQALVYHVRSSVTWSKINNRWQVVDQHTSRLPVAQ